MRTTLDTFRSTKPPVSWFTGTNRGVLADRVLIFVIQTPSSPPRAPSPHAIPRKSERKGPFAHFVELVARKNCITRLRGLSALGVDESMRRLRRFASNPWNLCHQTSRGFCLSIGCPRNGSIDVSPLLESHFLLRNSPPGGPKSITIGREL